MPDTILTMLLERPVVAKGPLFCGKRGRCTDRGIRNLLAVLGRRADVRIYAQPDEAALEHTAAALEGS